MPRSARPGRTDALARGVPAERDRVVDLVRVLALCGAVR
jgi:hypothetical protein